MHVGDGPFRRGVLQAVANLLFRQFDYLTDPTVHADLAKPLVESRPRNNARLRHTGAGAPAQGKVHFRLSMDLRVYPAAEVSRGCPPGNLEYPDESTFVISPPADIVQRCLRRHTLALVDVVHQDLGNTRAYVALVEMDDRLVPFDDLSRAGIDYIGTVAIVQHPFG